MQAAPGNRFTQRPHVHGVGRYHGTLQHVAADLNPDGTDYLLPQGVSPEATISPAIAPHELQIRI
jgi:hypothetical protein